ncbi:MAG: hypothetical protein LUO95_04585 [Methylococcaceae bacterium]|nr:hypothetical protein [Methylococcaceae bacterium]
MNRVCWTVCVSLLFFTSLAQAKPLAPEKVPDSLKPWISWVLQEQPERDCPFFYNSFEQKHCSWSTQLNLDLATSKGVFTGSWQVYKENDWIVLPGDEKHWPLSVTANGKTAGVMNKDGRPSIKLAAGIYDIKGKFLWDAIPDNLTLPIDTGLISLQMNGQTINMPTIKDGQLWLKDSDRGQLKPENVQNRIDVQVFRKVIDDLPLQVMTHLELEVSGEQREEKIAGSLLSDFIPLQLQCTLPARLEPNGQLVVQARAGRWTCDILARSSKELTQLTLPKDTVEPEIWVFDARPELRVVEIESLSTIDASQTLLPDDWRNLPAYKISPELAMSFKVIRRGDPEPEPNQLNLTRKLWLDFDGSGYTVNDIITGKMTSGWRLNALSTTALGKVTLDGNSQLITQQIGTDKKGVEVRRGSLMLDADSRIVGNIANMSAVGWEQNFHQVTAELNLPPGWQLLAATGVDNVPDSWISRWTLLDLFLVLIIALAIGRLWNRYWGGLALMTLVIIWHEADAPHFIWLHILAATALLSVPQGRFFKVANWYRRGSWLVLAFITLPFMVDQVRIGIYPQLENPWQDIYQDNGMATGGVMSSLPAPVPVAPPAAEAIQQAEESEVADMMQENKPAQPLMRKQLSRPKSLAPQKNAYYDNEYASKKAIDFARVDPKAKVQTGPGLPQWQWHKVMLSWNGAVGVEQQLSLWYLSPTMTMLLNFLRVLLVGLLALLMFGGAEKILPPFITKWGRGNKANPLLLCLLILPLLAMPTQKVYADDYPDDELLNQLRDKLQEQVIPDCLPACAHIQQMNMTINDKDIQITLQIDAQESVVLPLPAEYEQWFPNQVLDNGKAAQALYRTNNGLWINLKQGQHEVILRGSTPLLSKFTLPLPLKPNRVVVEKTGWEVFGLQENGWADDQLQFSRAQQTQADKTKPTLEQGALPPFVRVERTLQLGLDWRVITQITRISPAGSAVVLTVPLLKGESVTSAGIRVKNNAVEVNMAAQQVTLQWESSLEKADKIELIAPATEQWIEVWKADVSPVWHIESTGIAMIHLNSEGQWLPEWHPWANETVSLTITRPEPVAGKTLTIDSSRLYITQGLRMREAVLKASLRSSQGMQHTLTLPENAVLQSVAINGKTQPLRQEGRKLTLPVNPGKQDITLTWQEPTAISPILKMSKVDLGADSVNSTMTARLSEDRWVLFAFGPKMGPIILFWGMLIVVFLVSLGLGKIRLTPLKNWQWFLLLVGLSQIPIEAAWLVIGWLMLLGWRSSQSSEQTRFFNLLQISIGLLTLAALSVLFYAVAQGLLNVPNMQVTGNRSSALVLNWYQDRSASTLPAAKVISLPLIVYRLLMLAWALWLANALLNWLKWGWGCFSSNGLWRKKVVVEKKIVAAEQEPPKES